MALIILYDKTSFAKKKIPRLFKVLKFIFSGSSTELSEVNNLISFANIKIPQATWSGKSFTKRRNNRGSRLDPCGTPERIIRSTEEKPL